MMRKIEIKNWLMETKRKKFLFFLGFIYILAIWLSNVQNNWLIAWLWNFFINIFHCSNCTWSVISFFFQILGKFCFFFHFPFPILFLFFCFSCAVIIFPTKRKRQNNLALSLFFLIWVVSIALALPLLITSDLNTVFDDDKCGISLKICHEKNEIWNLVKLQFLFSFVFCFFTEIHFSHCFD